MKKNLWVLALMLVVAAAFGGVASATLPPGTPLKWSQPPVPADPAVPNVYWGWDEPSVYTGPPRVADDWLCQTNVPVTDIHWWGSYVGWDGSGSRPLAPVAFWFGIYTDVPAVPGLAPSHPGDLVWQYTSANYAEDFVGYDQDPRGSPIIDHTFQYTVYLPQPEWFYQPPTSQVWWLSIAAVYPTGATPTNIWGWKTRPHYYGDDAVRLIGQYLPGQEPGASWQPIEYPTGTSWDMAFELSTVPEPGSLLALGSGLAGLLGCGLLRRRRA